MGYSRKNLNKVGWRGLNHEIFRFITFCLCHWSFTPENCQNCCIPFRISKAKNQDPCQGNSTWFFLDGSWPWNSTSFLLTPLKYGNSTVCLSIQHPWKFHVLSPPPPPSPTVWIFLENGIAKLIKTDGPVVQQRHELFWVFGKKVKQINNLIHCWNSFKKLKIKYTPMTYIAPTIYKIYIPDNKDNSKNYLV